MDLYTNRLILRPWQNSDAESLYQYAKDPQVGPIAGWPPHTSVENSREIIKNVLAVDETYAVCLKEDNIAIGSIGLMIGSRSNLALSENEGEIGYWIGIPFWGRGLIPEAARELIRHSFEDLGLDTLWCGYFDGNIKSKRAQEKCGFTYHHTNENIHWALMDDIRTEHVTCLPKAVWEASRDKDTRQTEIDSLLALMHDTDNTAGYKALQELERISDETPLLYPYTDRFAAMISDENYAVRVRGIRLFCRQAKWDVDNKLDENIDAALKILRDPKPTAVRQALAALQYVVQYKDELRDVICAAASKIDYLRYKDTMHSLIAADIKELLSKQGIK